MNKNISTIKNMYIGFVTMFLIVHLVLDFMAPVELYHPIPRVVSILNAGGILNNFGYIVKLENTAANNNLYWQIDRYNTSERDGNWNAFAYYYPRRGTKENAMITETDFSFTGFKDEFAAAEWLEEAIRTRNPLLKPKRLAILDDDDYEHGSGCPATPVLGCMYEGGHEAYIEMWTNEARNRKEN